jgi:hypothetical protein
MRTKTRQYFGESITRIGALNEKLPIMSTKTYPSLSITKILARSSKGLVTSTVWKKFEDRCQGGNGSTCHMENGSNHHVGAIYRLSRFESIRDQHRSSAQGGISNAPSHGGKQGTCGAPGVDNLMLI